jgi:hypothetical protein
VYVILKLNFLIKSSGLAPRDIWVLLSVANLKVEVVVTFISTFRTIFIQQTRHTSPITLTTGPVVALKSVFDGGFLLLLCFLDLSHSHHFLTSHEFVLSQDQVAVITTALRLRDRVNSALQVDSTLGVIEKCYFSVFIDET